RRRHLTPVPTTGADHRSRPPAPTTGPDHRPRRAPHRGDRSRACRRPRCPPWGREGTGVPVKAGEPVPAWRTQAAYRLGMPDGSGERGPALGPSGGQIEEEVQPLRVVTLEASADFLLAAW